MKAFLDDLKGKVSYLSINSIKTLQHNCKKFKLLNLEENN